jgi:hypothetical protein
MGAICRFFFTIGLIVPLYGALSYKFFSFLSVPPSSTFYDLSHTHIVVTSTYKKFEVIRALFWLYVAVFLVQTTIELLHHFYIE